jgi:hypothetical protein
MARNRYHPYCNEMGTRPFIFYPLVGDPETMLSRVKTGHGVKYVRSYCHGDIYLDKAVHVRHCFVKPG